jgi:hypothetical protein
MACSEPLYTRISLFNINTVKLFAATPLPADSSTFDVRLLVMLVHKDRMVLDSLILLWGS